MRILMCRLFPDFCLIKFSSCLRNVVSIMGRVALFDKLFVRVMRVFSSEEVIVLICVVRFVSFVSVGVECGSFLRGSVVCSMVFLLLGFKFGCEVGCVITCLCMWDVVLVVTFL